MADEQAAIPVHHAEGVALGGASFTVREWAYLWFERWRAARGDYDADREGAPLEADTAETAETEERADAL